MRGIKFRVWDNQVKCFLDCNSDCMERLYIIDDGASDLFKVNYEGDHDFMQFTGLRDSRGIEIYQGDIIEIREKNSVWVGEVRYNEKVLNNCIYYDGEFKCHLYKYKNYENRLKIIGNIFEGTEK